MGFSTTTCLPGGGGQAGCLAMQVVGEAEHDEVDFGQVEQRPVVREMAGDAPLGGEAVRHGRATAKRPRPPRAPGRLQGFIMNRRHEARPQESDSDGFDATGASTWRVGVVGMKLISRLAIGDMIRRGDRQRSDAQPAWSGVFSSRRREADLVRFSRGRHLLTRRSQMDKMETEAAGARSTRLAGAHRGDGLRRLRPQSSIFGELFQSLSRRRIVMTPSLDDHSLWKRVAPVKPRRSASWSSVTRRDCTKLYCTCAGRSEDAKDVLQDTFLRAYEKLDQFHGDSSFYTWVYRIGVNLALSGHRRRRAQARGSANWRRCRSTGLKTPRTNRPMPTRPTLSNGPSASRSSKPPSTSLVRNTGPSSS